MAGGLHLDLAPGMTQPRRRRLLLALPAVIAMGALSACSSQTPAAAPKTAMPRFWLAPKYEPLLKDEEGLAWQLRGSGVQALTEDGYVTASGEIVDRVGKEEPLAKKWVETMSARYEELSAAAPVFAELRGCMDLAVVAALLTKEDLPGLAGDHDRQESRQDRHLQLLRV